MEEITIFTDYIKLDSFMKLSNFVETGGEAKYVIADGLVRVNGAVCKQRGKKLYPGDIVIFDGNDIRIVADDGSDLDSEFDDNLDYLTEYEPDENN